MAFIFDFSLTTLPVLDAEWAKLVGTPGNSTKGLTALLTDAKLFETNVGGPWLQKYSGVPDRGQAFANAVDAVRKAIAASAQYPKATVEGAGKDVWVPLPDGRHILHTRVLDGAKGGIVRSVKALGLTLSYELLVEAMCNELME